MSPMAETLPPQALPDVSHEALLGILAQAESDGLKRFAESVLDRLGAVDVLSSRTGLVMLPLRDTAAGTAFHLGEVLVAEAHVRAGAQEGYGMRTGRDLEAAMAMALVDLAVARGTALEDIAAFVERERARQAAQEETRMRAVEATRVDMETF